MGTSGDKRTALASVIALALVPFLSLPLAPTHRLPAQAGLILLLLAGQAPWLTAHREPLPWVLRFGMGAWFFAATWGAGIGLIYGNPLQYVMGQWLSLVLLPAGAVVFGHRRGYDWRPLVGGLAVASLVALALHLGLPALELDSASAGPVAEKRLRLAPGVSFVGTSLLAALVCGGGLLCLKRGRWLVAAGAVAAGLIVVGGFSRGQWLAAAVGVSYLIGGLLRERGRRTWIAISALSAAGVVLGVWVGTAGESLPIASLTGGDRWQVGGTLKNRELARFAWVGGRGVEAAAWVEGPPGEHLLLWTETRPGERAKFRRTYTRVAGTSRRSRVLTVVTMPAGSQELRVGAWISGGNWTVEGLELRRIDSSLATRLRTWGARPTTVEGREPSWWAVLQKRAQQLVWALREPGADDTVGYRAGENAAVVKAWKQSGWVKRLVGAGLGATVEHGIPSYDSEGRKFVLPRTSYLHNFYLFIGYKLGVVGLLLLAALAAFAGQAWQVGARHCAFGRAAFAAWLSYGVWSLTSPEILDFRRAVLWGLLVAASGRVEVGLREGLPGRAQPPVSESDVS